MNEKINDIKSLIGKDRIKAAILETLELLKNNEYRNEAIIYSASFTSLEEAYRKGLIDWDKARIGKNQIIISLLQLLDLLENSDESVDETRIEKELESIREYLIKDQSKGPFIYFGGLMLVLLIIIFVIVIDKKTPEGYSRPSVDPDLRKKEELKGQDGREVNCFQPPPSFYNTELETHIDEKIPSITTHLDAITSIHTKVERIREELPSLNTFEALEFRMCVAYANGAINKDQYYKFIETILPSLVSGNNTQNGNNNYENNVGESYMRLFGALEAPIVMRLISGASEGRKLNSSNVISDTTYSGDCNYCGGHIHESIIDFWKNDWEYSNILPLNTDLWNGIVNDDPDFYELDLFWTASITNEIPNHDPRRNAWCYVNSLFPWDVKDSIKESILQDENGKSLCNEQISNDIGFLFLILENFSDKRLDNLEFHFKHIPSDGTEVLSRPFHDNFYSDVEGFESRIVDTSRTEYVKKLKNDIEIETQFSMLNEQSKFFPRLLPNQSVIWILGIYIKNEEGYPLAYLSDVTKPTKISYILDGVQMEEIIREPAKNAAIKVNLPFGWYGQ